MTGSDYKLSVPVMNRLFRDHMDREKTVGILKQMKADRVFIASESNSAYGERKEKELEALKENAAYLHENGFEVGAWFWTFFDTELKGYRRFTSPDGRESRHVICPTDENYRRIMTDFLTDCAATGVDMIMFDDDFRYGFLDVGIGCLCEGHLAKIGAILGEKVTREQVEKAICSGGKNRVRDAFIRANGEVFEEFAAECRRAVDKADPSVRLGFCSCITSWDLDGTTPDRLARVLAGNTKPFYRLIGAPYWTALNAWGHARLSYVIELERLEASRRENSDIEIFSEGDTYPRPRFRVPAAYLEGFDTALRAAGCTDGILKYSFDYHSDCDYETGYNDRHIRHLPLYEEIGRVFGNKTEAGVRVYDSMRKIPYAEMPLPVGKPEDMQELAFNRGSRFAASCSLPVTYGGCEYGGIAFGLDALAIPETDLGAGLVLDYPAAKILSERGVDVGIRAVNGTVKVSGDEYFINGVRTSSPEMTLYDVTPDEKAETDSWLYDGGRPVPFCFRYENAEGARFVIYTFEGYFTDEAAYRSYARQNQMTEALAWAARKNLPVSCAGHPDLYIIAKKSGDKIAAGLWNFFPDDIVSPKITFENEIVSAAFTDCAGVTEGNTVTLERIDPYGFAAVEATVRTR